MKQLELFSKRVPEKPEESEEPHLMSGGKAMEEVRGEVILQMIQGDQLGEAKRRAELAEGENLNSESRQSGDRRPKTDNQSAAAATGLRAGELLALRWRDFDPSGPTLFASCPLFAHPGGSSEEKIQ